MIPMTRPLADIRSRQAFTLIELMIVIAIIAIIAAIAIPNLLESRVTSQESAAAVALRTGVTPAQIQFQAGGFSDVDGNGIGAFAFGSTAYSTLSGLLPISGLTLNMLPGTYRGAEPVIGGYIFQEPVTSALNAIGPETTWAVGARPVDINNGRRQFIINQTGPVFASYPSATAADSITLLDPALFTSNCSGRPGTLMWQPYIR